VPGPAQDPCPWTSSRGTRRTGPRRCPQPAAPPGDRVPHLVHGARAGRAHRQGPLRDVPAATRHHLGEVTRAFIDAVLA